MYKVKNKARMAHHQESEKTKKIPLDPLANVPKPKKPN